MSEVDFVVSEGNISLFVDQLRWDTSPDNQDALKRLLIREEDRFGEEQERLRLTERMLRDGADNIARQTRLIAVMKSNGTDTCRAERTLRTFQMIQLLFEQFRDAIYERSECEPLALTMPPLGGSKH